MRIVVIITAIFAVISANSCTQLSNVYDLVAPPVQYDHEKSELGLAAYKDLDDKQSLKKQGGTEFSLQHPKKLDLSRKTYLILQVDGGGIMGIAPALLTEKIEMALQQRRGFSGGKLKDVLSVCSGTSTGAIIAGGVAAGVPASELADFYTRDAYELFQGKGRLPLAPIFQNKLSREAFQEEMIRTLEAHADYPSGVRLGELDPVPSVILAGYDLVSKRTIFLRNHDDPDSALNTREIQLIDAVSASALSAALYFGKLPAPEVEIRQLLADGTGYTVKGVIWADGGQGTQNTTVTLAAIEALRIKMAEPDAQVVIISLGCGNDFGEREFHDVIKFRTVHHITDFFFRNQARSESILLQWMAASKIESIVDDIKVFRFDWHHTSTRDADSFSINARQRQFLIDKADEMAARPDFLQLMSDLSNDRLRISRYRR